MELLAPCRTPDEWKRYIKYIEDVCFFLCAGEQAPFKSRAEILSLPLKTRDYHVQRLSEMYEKQREEMEKSSKKR
jgi:hypothetical protein